MTETTRATHCAPGDGPSWWQGLPPSPIEGDAVPPPGDTADELPDEGKDVPPTPRDRLAWPALASSAAVGDPGRLAEVVPISGHLTVGVADTLLEFSVADPFTVRACSTRGYSHRYLGTPRQDAFAVLDDDAWLVVAVADGVGAATYSHIAADVAARSACRFAVDALRKDGEPDWELLGRRVSVQIAREAVVRNLVDEQGENETIEEHLKRVRELLCTTLVVLALPKRVIDGRASGTVAVIAGDSGSYQLSDGALRPLLGGKASTGEIMSTAVRPLPGPAVPDVCRVSLADGEALVLVSDGIGDPLGNAGNALGRWIAERWASPPPVEQFLVDCNFHQRGWDDDRTAVAIWLLPPVERLDEADAAT